MGATYSIRRGFAVPGDPTQIGSRLEALKQLDGRLVPEDVVRDAERADSPLHPCFEWDDTEAARLHRLSQARYLIRSIEVRYEAETPREDVVVSVQYVNLGTRSAPEPYRDVRDVMGDPELRARYVASVLGELKAMRDKYRHVGELADVYAAIDRLVAVLLP